ncbi:MAG: immunity 49 family protein [Gammaproteobacteria bacterium]|nr:immunity 49 family protein [Gammaproteobacteria bacterium]
MDPRDARPLLAEALEEAWVELACQPEAEQALKVLERLVEYYPPLGLAHLLSSGDQARLRECLVRSAWARLHQLRQGAALSPLPRHCATSFNAGLVHAIAAGHWPLAQAIAAACPADWHSRGEYEDDFCYYRLLGLFAGDTLDRPTALALLRRYAQALQGQRPARLKLCQAYVAGSAEDFAESLGDFLREQGEALSEAEERLGEEDADFAAFWCRRFVDLEALAWLPLGERAGMAPPGPHPRLPPGAVLRGPCPNYADPIAELEAAR